MVKSSLNLGHQITYFPTSLGVSEWTSKQTNKHSSEASRVEQANERALQANELVDKQAAQYSHPDSWLLWTTVEKRCNWKLDPGAKEKKNLREKKRDGKEKL